MTSEIPTPRVDGRTVLTPVLGLEGDMHELVTADFARQLERENAVMREALQRFRDGEWTIDFIERGVPIVLDQLDAMRRAFEEGK